MQVCASRSFAVRVICLFCVLCCFKVYTAVYHIIVAISALRAAKYAITHSCETDGSHTSILRDQNCSVCL